jgi:hypothetical protein
MKVSERRQIDENHECEGQIEGATDKEGKIHLVLKVEHCPTRSIESEELYVTVTERNYVTYQESVTTEQIDIALERYGYYENYPPLKIEYLKYAVDVAKYKKNFDLLNEMNKINIDDKLPSNSYFALEYSHQESSGQEGFNDFLEKIEFISNIKGLSLLKEVLDNNYPLPYKRTKFKEEESWRSSDLVYAVGRQAARKAIWNISDDRADSLMPLAINIPEEYLQLLKEYGIKISPMKYSAFFLERNISKPQKSPSRHNPSTAQLSLLRSTLKENTTPQQYPDSLAKAYQIAVTNSAKVHSHAGYTMWQIDKDSLANELFELNSRMFTDDVKRLLPAMEANSTTRRYLLYLYKQGEYEYLAHALKTSKTLMGAFLAEDVIETSGLSPSTNETRDLGVEECLITRMPEVTNKIKNAIAAYLKDESVNYSFYRWWIRNLAYIDLNAANVTAIDIYSRSQIDPYKLDYRSDQDKSIYAKRYVLRGAAEAKLIGLCEEVYTDLQPKDKIKRDFFSLAEERIHYLSAACPSEFNVTFVKDRAKSGQYEPSYGSDYGQNDFRDSIWRGVEAYFPKEPAVRILGQYICNNNEVILGAYGGGNVLPRKYLIPCLCERLEKDLLTVDKAAASRLTDYLDRCYPERKQAHWRERMLDQDKQITDRTYTGLLSLVKGTKGYATPHTFHDGRFKAFFTGTTSTAESFKGTMIDWASGISADKAFPLLQQALNSRDQTMLRSALYAYSFYPSQYTSAIVVNLKGYSSQSVYPDYLYAAYSLAMSKPAESEGAAACKRAAAHHLNIIEGRALGRYEPGLAFNVLLNLDLCSRTGQDEEYLRLLNAIFTQNSMGRYESFQDDLEGIVLRSGVKLDRLIGTLTNADDGIDNIVGLRLAQIKMYQLDSELLRKLLINDDSYVRLAAANYIKANNNQYRALYISLKDNTNKKVRKLYSE